MFESLSEKLEGALKTLAGQGRINELNIAQSMREVRRALLDADVNYQVARDFTERIKEQALGEDVLSSVSPGQQLSMFGEIGHCGLTDEFEWHVVGTYHIDGKTYGPDLGPDGTVAEQFGFIFRNQN